MKTITILDNEFKYKGVINYDFISNYFNTFNLLDIYDKPSSDKLVAYSKCKDFTFKLMENKLLKDYIYFISTFNKYYFTYNNLITINGVDYLLQDTGRNKYIYMVR